MVEIISYTIAFGTAFVIINALLSFTISIILLIMDWRK